MSFLKEFPDNVHLGDVMKAFPGGIEELMKFHDVVLRGSSPLSIAEREMIAAFVSRLNGCRFCFNSHRVYAAFYGVEPELFDRLMADIETSGVDEKLKPILRYAKKITLDHGNIEKSDIDAILAAGWDGQAVNDAASVAALFNYMNRIVHALGVDAHDEVYDKRLAAVLKKPLEARIAQNDKDIGSSNYVDFARALKVF
ncbi:MAG: carboxymuconolactone decarboxylase family protein [Alphaproteobacteria bacterium]